MILFKITKSIFKVMILFVEIEKLMVVMVELLYMFDPVLIFV